MTDDNGTQHNTGDPAEAFEGVRAEVALLRRAVERLAAERGEIETVDYTETLASIAAGVTATAQRVGGLAKSPALKLTPDSYGAQLRRAADDASRPAAAELQRAQALTGTLERALGRARTRDEQRGQLLRIGGGALAIGALLCVLLLPPIARTLPASWHVPETLAAGIIGEDRWTAGVRMMANQAPAAWARIESAAKLEAANRKTIKECSAAAAKAGNAVRCSVQVKPPRK